MEGGTLSSQGPNSIVLNPTSVPYRQLAAILATERTLTTSLSGCCGSGPLLAFLTASCTESWPAFGFASFVPLRCSCQTDALVSPGNARPHRTPRTVCFLLSAASRAAWRGLAGMLSSPPSVCVVPMILCPPCSVPGFEQSPPIRVGDRERERVT